MKKFILLIFVLSCSAKRTDNIKICLKDKDCGVSSNSCKSITCLNYQCVEKDKKEYETCGLNKVCYQDQCLIIGETCNNDNDCLSPNTCLEGICSENKKCIYFNKEEGATCGADRLCVSGNCTDNCYLDSDCTENNPCSNSTCNNIKYLNEASFNPIVSLAYGANHWWLLNRSDKKVYKYDNLWQYSNFSFLTTISTNQNVNMFYKDLIIYIIDKEFILKYSIDGTYIATINLKTDSQIPSDILPTSTFNLFFHDNFWWIFAINMVYKLDENFIYTNHYQIDINANRVFFDKDNWIIASGTPQIETTVKFYDTNFIYTGVSKTITVNNNGTNDFRMSTWYLLNNSWNIVFNKTGALKVYLFDTEFNVKSYCLLSNKVNSTVCPGGFCYEGICSECGKNSDCIDDNNPCTSITCNLGTCLTSNLSDASPCGTGKYCFNGTCMSSCANHSNCAEDTFCRDNFCDNTSHQCSFAVKNLGQVCATPYYNQYCLSNATCNNSYYYTKLCATENEVVNTGGDKAPTFIIMFPSINNYVPNGEKVLEVVAKFIDGDKFKCAGYRAVAQNGNSTLTCFGNISGSSKVGFASAETINLFVRTNNFICRVFNPILDTDIFPYCNQLKWYSLHLCALIGFETLDFNNTSKCCNVLNAACINNLNSL